MRRRDTRSGFTLLELLMVVIIIAILASIALPQYVRVTERARVAQVLQLMSSVRGSQVRFKAMDPAAVYSADLTKIDLAPLPPPPNGWGAMAMAGATINSPRTTGGTLSINVDTGVVCGTAAEALIWGVQAGGC